MIDVALVGCAHIHTPGFVKKLAARSDVRVKYVWDHESARAAAHAGALGGQAIPDLKTAWSDRAVAAAIICSETDRHEELAVAAAGAGKHLFVEKPLGLGAADGYRIAAAVTKAGVLFQTGYGLRQLPVHRFLKAQIAKGAFGRITRIRHTNCHAGSLKGWFDTEWRWMADPARAGGGGFADLGTHSLDILLWLMGSPTSVTASLGVATGRYGDCDEYGEGLLRFAGGAIASIAAGWVDVAHPVSAVVSGTEAHAHILGGELYLRSDGIPGADGARPWTDLPEALPHPLDLFLDAVLASASDRGAAARAKAELLVGVGEAAERAAVMEALYQSARAATWVMPRGPEAAARRSR